MVFIKCKEAHLTVFAFTLVGTHRQQKSSNFLKMYMTLKTLNLSLVSHINVSINFFYKDIHSTDLFCTLGPISTTSSI